MEERVLIKKEDVNTITEQFADYIEDACFNKGEYRNDIISDDFIAVLKGRFRLYIIESELKKTSIPEGENPSESSSIEFEFFPDTHIPKKVKVEIFNDTYNKQYIKQVFHNVLMDAINSIGDEEYSDNCAVIDKVQEQFAIKQRYRSNL